MQLELVCSVIPVLGSVHGGEQKKGMRVRKQERGETFIKGRISLFKLLDMESKWCCSVSLSEQLNS